MPNRMLRESCRTSPTLDVLSDGAERLFWRLLTCADDYGRFEGEPLLVKAACFPRRVDTLPTATVAGWLDELIAADLIRAYVVEGKAYAHFVTWAKHQRVRESKPKYPEPPAPQPVAEDTPVPSPPDPDSRRMAATRGDSPPLAANGGKLPRLAASCGSRDGSGSGGEREREGEGTSCADAFAQFWEAYPRKVGKADAAKAWRQRRPPLARCLATLAWQRRDPAWLRDGGRYVPHPGRWLRGGQWDDAPPEWATRRPAAALAARLAPVAPPAPIPDDERARVAGGLSALVGDLARAKAAP